MAIHPQLNEAVQALNETRQKYDDLLSAYTQRIDSDIGAAISGSKVYVDQVAGDDANNGNQNTPFATLAKAIESCTGNTLNIIHLKPNQVHTTTAGTSLGTKWFTGQTTLQIRRYDTENNDDTNYPTIHVMTEQLDGKDQASQMIRFKGKLHLLLDDVNIVFKAPASPLTLLENRKSWIVPTSYGGGQPFDVSASSCEITTETGGLYMFNALNSSTLRMDLMNIALDGPQKLLAEADECATVVSGNSVTTTGTKISDGVPGNNVLAPSSLSSLFGS